MLPDIVPCVSASRPVAGIAHVAWAWHVLEVAGPCHVLVLEQVDDGCDILRQAHPVVVIVAEVVAGEGSEVIGLARVSVGVVSGQQNALALQVDDAAVDDDLGVVLTCSVCGQHSECKRQMSLLVGRDELGSRAKW